MIDTKELRRICEDAKDFHAHWHQWVGAKMRADYLPSVAEYFTAAIERLPALLDELDAARAEIERLKAEQSPQKEPPSGYWDAAREAKTQVDSWPQWKKDAARAAFHQPEDTQP